MLKSAIRDQFTITTWLVLGASAQSLLFTFIPLKYASLPAVTYLLYNITRTTLQVSQWVPHSSFPPPIPSGFQSAVPPSSLAEPQPIVVFVLGFQSSHPLGRLGPGLKELGEYFMGITKEAEENRGTSGYLGTSGPMLTMDGETSNALVTITYWRSLEQLAVFSKQGVHAKTMKWFYDNKERYPHIGEFGPPPFRQRPSAALIAYRYHARNLQRSGRAAREYLYQVQTIRADQYILGGRQRAGREGDRQGRAEERGTRLQQHDEPYEERGEVRVRIYV